MKKRIKIIVILSCVFVLSLAAFALSSCTLPKLTKDDLLEMGYGYTVTFDFNEGKMGELETIEVQVEENSVCPEPGTVTDIRYKKPVRDGYILDGYSLEEVDGDGDEDITFWNFKTGKISEDITLHAVWRKAYTLVVKYVDDEAEEGEKDKSYSVTVDQDKDRIPQSVNEPSITGYTVLDFYSDEALTEGNEVYFPLTPDTADLNKDKKEMVIYAKVLKGTWKVIKKEKDLTTFMFGEATNIYLTCDIDMNKIYDPEDKIDWDNIDWNSPYNEKTMEALDALAKFNIPNPYNGKIDGNNHTISNLRIRQEQDGRGDREFGIFKNLGESAQIKNITFKDVNFYAKITNKTVTDYYVGLLAGRAAEGAKIENVKISGTIECDITTDKVNDNTESPAEKTEIYPFLGDSGQYCTPVDCEYTNVTVIKNGEEVNWKDQQADTATN